mmetsp:Transcript_9553/g.25982  ORF Transcript_9553/g.25982 Transcript_9553/m.25982 type:complete len:501 (+) Transcript_9553:119-1621(+)
MAKNNELKECLISNVDANHDPHLYGNKLEDSPAYEALARANLLVSDYRKDDISDLDLLKSNTSKNKNLWRRIKFCLKFPVCGLFWYDAFYKEYLVPAGHVLKLRDDKGGYFLAGPGMHLVESFYVYSEGKPETMRGLVEHGDCYIVTVEQGFVGFAIDRGQPVLLPPGLHQWKSDTMYFVRFINLNDHKISMGPYTLLTVDEGYAAVTQNNGKQVILPGGAVHLLDHKNWKFEKFMTIKIQTDNLERIQATSADNIIMNVTSTVNWRIVDVECAATLAAETMAISGRSSDVSADISKLREDVLKQAIASLSSFIASVNYSDSFHLAAAAQASASSVEGVPVSEEGDNPKVSRDNPMFDVYRMKSAVEHANIVTRRYGIEIMSINIISANPVDQNLTRALASGAVAAAEALQAETTARGKSKALQIEAEAKAKALKIEAEAEAGATLIKAEADMDAAKMLQQSEVAIDLAKINASAVALGDKSKLFFAKEPEYMKNLFSVQ